MKSETGKIFSINLALTSQKQSWSDSGNQTGINKLPISGAATFAKDCVEGDQVVDRKHHGGYDKAVYAYAREDAIWWESLIGREITPGQFGENLTTLGIDVSGAIIGERWKLGTVILEVAEPRIPCTVFSGFWDRPTLIKEFTEAGRPGAYLRIIQEGVAREGQTIEIISLPSHGISIGDIYAAKSGERSRIAEIAALSELSAEYRAWALKVLPQ